MITRITPTQISFTIKIHYQDSQQANAIVNSTVEISEGISLIVKEIDDGTALLKIAAPPNVWVRDA